MLTPKRLMRTTLPVAAAVLYTVPAGVRTRIDAIAVTNFSAVPATFSLWIAPPGAVQGDGNNLIPARSIAAGSSARVLEAIGQWLEAGEQLFMVASVASAVNVTASGVEQTTS